MCADRPDPLGEPLAWHLVERLRQVYDLGDHQIRQPQLVAGHEELGRPCRLAGGSPVRWRTRILVPTNALTAWSAPERREPGGAPPPRQPRACWQAGSPRRRGRAGRGAGDQGDAVPPGVQPGRLAWAGRSGPGHGPWWRWGDSNSGPPPDVAPRGGCAVGLSCGSLLPVMTTRARCSPLPAGGVCTQRVPAGSRPVADVSGAPVLRDRGPIGRPGTARPIKESSEARLEGAGVRPARRRSAQGVVARGG